MISTSRKVSSTCGNHVCWGKRGKIYKGFCKKWFFKVSKFVYFLKPFQSSWSNNSQKNIFFRKYFLSKIFFEKIFFFGKIFLKQNIFGKNIFFGIVEPNALKWLWKKDKFLDFKISLFTKSFVNFSKFYPPNVSWGVIPNMATYKNYPIDLPILVIEAQIFVAVKKFPFLPNKQIPNTYIGKSISG